MKFYHLILTDLDKPKKINKNTFFFSDWITQNSFEKKKIIKKPLKSFKKKVKAHNYINKIRHEVTSILANYIFIYHNKKFSKNLISSMISLWVSQYLQFKYFRWLQIDELLKEGREFIISDIEIDPNINDYLDALDFMDLAHENDIFNYFHLRKILLFRKSEFKNKIIFKKIKKFHKKNFIQRDSNYPLKSKIVSFIDKTIDLIFNPLIKNNQYFLKEGFSYKNLIILNTKLKQFPYFGNFFFDWFKLRKKINLSRNKIDNILVSNKLKNKFEKYICSNIINDIPLIFLEGFDYLEIFKKKINLNPKIIVSSHSHFYNELFKFWSFQRKFEKKSKIIIFNHGGNHSKLSPVFDYENSVSNQFYDWVNTTNKLCGMTKYLHHNIKRKVNKKILFVGIEYRKYPCRLYPGPIHHDEMNSINHLAFISRGLNENFKGDIYYSPNRTILPAHKKIIYKHLEKKQILENLSFKKNIKNFSIIICSSPMTTFFDSILSGPTLLLIDKQYWITSKSIELKYKILQDNKILFYEVKDLVSNLNKIYPNKINDWWNSQKVQQAIKAFLKEFNYPSNHNDYQKRIIEKIRFK